MNAMFQYVSSLISCSTCPFKNPTTSGYLTSQTPTIACFNKPSVALKNLQLFSPTRELAAPSSVQISNFLMTYD